MFWTDSTIVLQFIHNEVRRFKVFVANRIAEIRDSSHPDQWNHVCSNENPADVASRGSRVQDLSTLWFPGPNFLKLPEEDWPKLRVPLGDLSGHEDVKRVFTITKTTEGVDDPLLKFYEAYSDWNKLKRGVAWLLKFKDYLKKKIISKTINVEYYNKAEHATISYVQQNCFPELKLLRNNEPISKSSSLLSLNPVLHNDLLIVGGRLQRAPFDSSKSIILPNRHHIVDLIIQKFHYDNGHVGREYVLSSLRSKY